MDYQEGGIVLTVFRIMQQSTDNRHLIFGQSHRLILNLIKINNRTKESQKMDHTERN